MIFQKAPVSPEQTLPSPLRKDNKRKHKSQGLFVGVGYQTTNRPPNLFREVPNTNQHTEHNHNMGVFPSLLPWCKLKVCLCNIQGYSNLTNTCPLWRPRLIQQFLASWLVLWWCWKAIIGMSCWKFGLTKSITLWSGIFTYVICRP